MKRTVMFKLIAGVAMTVMTSCAGEFDPELASDAASDSLQTAGVAYQASVEAAENQILTLVSSLQALSFAGSLPGVTGFASWSGTLEPTENLELNYVITFVNYSASDNGVQLNGELAIAVSESNTDCSGAWNTNSLLIFDPIDDLTFAMTTIDSGLILSGIFCDIMSLSGQVDVSGDAIGNDCPVSGTTANPNVAC